MQYIDLNKKITENNESASYFKSSDPASLEEHLMNGPNTLTQ